ncbi:MAG: deoxynucleoside kinase [Anaerolineaceae bacterium]|nr:MAG: deoxynucleoside kinase [Anaerolineaceae bacterium]
MRDYFIAIAGNIGAGKSTLTGMLARNLGWQPFYEANDENPYLEDFYRDMRRWSFQSQAFFLSKRLEHHRQLVDYPGSVVQDRTVYEDAEVFARNLHRRDEMTARDYQTYRSLYGAICQFLPPPDLVIYLQASVDTLLRHIARRGRDFEQTIQRQYVADLNGLYDEWIDGWTASPVLRVDMNRYDFQHDDADFQMILAGVDHHLGFSPRRAQGQPD